MFYASQDSLDDLLRAVFKQLLTGRGNFEVASSKGRSTEVFGALLELKNPRARLSRSFSKAKAFSPLGELFWYLAGSDSVEFIKHYIPIYPKLIKDEVRANGAYGPRIFGDMASKKRDGNSEWDRVIRTLRKGSGSRNALIQIFGNSDAVDGNHDKPCTCTIQFVIRKGRLLMHTHMRSNDAYMGLPHDIFTFTMLQEIAARELEIGMGPYTHSVASLHLYHDSEATEDHPPNTSMSGAKANYREGFHEARPMPEMPLGDPWPSIEQVKIAEQAIRDGNIDYTAPTGLASYWKDIIELFRIYKMFEDMRKRGDDRTTEWQELRRIVTTTKEISPIYELYIRDKLQRKLQRRQSSVQDLFENAR